MTIDPRGSHEVIIEQIEEEKHLSKKQNLRYKYLHTEDVKGLKKIKTNNKRSRRKSLNNAHCTPLMNRSDLNLDIRINEQTPLQQNLGKFINSHRERCEVTREPRNHSSLCPIIRNSDGEIQNYRRDSFSHNSKNIQSRKKEERKSNSDPHSPFASFNDQTVPQNPIDDYGRTWTSATLADP